MAQQLITDFIRDTASEPFSWGVCDCALWAADMVVRATGVDPAEDLRGRYNSYQGAHLLMMEAGGLARLIKNRMDDFQPLGAEGGVGVAVVSGRTHCGLIMSDRFAIKANHAVRLVSSYQLIEGWSLCLKPHF